MQNIHKIERNRALYYLKNFRTFNGNVLIMFRLANIFFPFCLFIFSNIWAQGTFHLPPEKKSIKIPVDVVNNLIIMPVSVNGTTLSFLLDTGVRSTILFNVEQGEDVQLNDAKTIYLTGAGSGLPTEALKSQHNILNIGTASAINQDIYFITDGATNFSPRLGQAVNGIIGTAVFKDFIVEVNYEREFIELHDPMHYKYKRCRSCITTSISFKAGKPYVDLFIIENNSHIPVTLLLDSGSGDALWLFENSHKAISVKEPNFEDFLGLGLSGEVTGRRTKLPEVRLEELLIKDVTVAYPDSLSMRHLNRAQNRNGSLGAEVLRRFKIVYDYPNNRITLKKNRSFSEPYRYNRSGLVVQHSGYEVVKELEGGIKYQDAYQSERGMTTIFEATNTIQFKLKPNYEIAKIRKDSPGARAGLLAGDKIIKVNGRDVRNLKLEDITKFFFKNHGYVLRLKVNRNGIVFNCKFKLERVL